MDVHVPVNALSDFLKKNAHSNMKYITDLYYRFIYI